jgi:hypothetical protein
MWPDAGAEAGNGKQDLHAVSWSRRWGASGVSHNSRAVLSTGRGEIEKRREAAYDEVMSGGLG